MVAHVQRVRMMAHTNLGEKWVEVYKELGKRSEGYGGTKRDISIEKLHWQPVYSECSPIISIHQQSKEEEDYGKGT